MSLKLNLFTGQFDFDTNSKVRYDSGDTTSGYIVDKFVAGTGISLSEGTGADENKLKITNSGVVAETDPLSLHLDQTTPQTVVNGQPVFDQGLKITAGQDIRPSTNSTSAINIAQADGTDFVTFDTTNKRVGIGTTSPSFKLHAVVEGDEPVLIADKYSGGDYGYSTAPFLMRAARGTIASPLALKNGDIIFSLSGRGHTGSSFTPFGRAVINGHASEDWTPSANGTYLAFRVVPTGSSTIGEVMRMYGDGEIVIYNDLTIGSNKTTPTPNIPGSIKLWSAGDNDYYSTFITGTQTANATYTLPTAMPTVSGYVLSSTDAGVMSWVAQSAPMIYPGAGLAKSTGSAWDTSVTDNSANWNTAYSWGDHALVGYLTSLTGLLLDQTTPQTVINGQPIFGQGLKITSGQDIRPSTDSTTAINIAQADGTDWVTFNTTNKRVGIGTTSPSEVLDVVGDIEVSADIHTLADSGKHYFGAADDASITFTGTSLDIQSDVVTATDELNLRGGTNGIDFLIGVNEEMTLTADLLTFSDTTNIAFNTSIGTKIGTSTSQKLGFWNATPIIQPVNTTAIDALLVNTGLRASGAYANFATTLQPRTGSASANTAPIKMTSGALLATSEAGAIEFNTDDYYVTITTGAGGNYSYYPPAQSDTYVKSLTKHSTSFWAFYATDPAKSLTGAWDGNSWVTSGSNQTFHIDLGSNKLVNRIYYENNHYSGGATTSGAKDYAIYGSDNASAFADTAWASDTNWTLIQSGLQFVQHTGSDVADPQYQTLTNSTSYRYYRIKISNNWGGAYLGLRRIELQDTTQASAQKKITLTNTTLTSGRIPYATTNGRLTDSANLTYDGTILTLGDANNIAVNATTGTKIGTATSQKLGFFNSTPIVQPVNTTAIDTALIGLGLWATGASYTPIDKVLLAKDAVYFTQTDGAEKIDSDADGDLDYYAGISHDFIIGSTEQITLTDGMLSPTTNNDIDLGDSTHKFKNGYFAGKLTVDGELDPTAVDFTQISTPANPASGHNKIYFKSDDKLYKLTSSGAETEIGGLGGETLAQTLAIGNVTGGNDISFDTDGDVIIGNGQTSIDPYNRSLFASDGTTEILDYSTDGTADFGDNDVATTGAVKGVHKAADGTSAVADGTYTVGIGGTQNGTITITDGIITAVQEAIA
jgi:hypothetical protein